MLYLCGYSIDNLSLMALTIADGFVVDDAIVVIENITRHTETGCRRWQAALHGAAEIGFTVLSISISLIAVFIPILLMGGHRGTPVPRIRHHAVGGDRVFAGDFADHDADDVRAPVSGRDEGKKHNIFYRLSGWSVDSMRLGYEKSLGWVLRHQPLMLAVTLATVALTRVSLHHRAQGIFSAAGCRPAFGHHHRGSGDFVPGDARPASWSL